MALLKTLLVPILVMEMVLQTCGTPLIPDMLQAAAADREADEVILSSSHASSLAVAHESSVAAESSDSISLQKMTSSCVDSCRGQRNGYFHSCVGCRVYISCRFGMRIRYGVCSWNRVWDDNKKRCLRESSTCIDSSEGPKSTSPIVSTTELPPVVTTGTNTTTAPPTRTSTFSSSTSGIPKIKTTNSPLSDLCVQSCSNLPNGDYQSCKGCDVFVTCSNGLTYDERPCPAGLVWDDSVKRCESTSSTCKAYPCVDSCYDLPNGDYQSCQGCSVYVTCSNGLTYDQRPCPAGLVWDDHVKRCERTSSTCRNKDTSQSFMALETGEASIVSMQNDGNVILESESESKIDTSRGCVSSCDGKPNGDYQSCHTCNVYVTCANGVTYDDRPCPANLIWDDHRKRCGYTSTTCRDSHCIDSCEDVINGNYQSCQGCHVFASCSSGILYDNRPCPSDLVWDDNTKRCSYESATCQGV